MREELERLRQDAAAASASVGDASGLCPLPTCIPEIPPGMRVSDQMHVLVDTCVDPTSKHRVGFFGM
jgi:hypothetical protein